jgi:transposase
VSARLEVVVVRRRVSEGLWRRVAPLLPVVERRFRYPGRKRVDDRLCLEGILFVLFTGLPWREVPAELGVSGITCWRRLAEWQHAGVWEQLLGVLVSELKEQGQLDPARLIVDASIAPAKKGARKLGQARWIAVAPQLSDT